MLTNVSSADYLITGDSIQHKENVQETGKSKTPVNIYAKPAEFNDSFEVSEQAKRLFEREKDIQFFTSKVMETPLRNEELSAIMKLIQESEFISNADLAEALQGDSDLMKHLFS